MNSFTCDRSFNVQVTWRRHHESHPLTVGLDIFASDASIAVETVPASLSNSSQDVSEWRLIVNSVRHQDAGLYHCQVTAKHSRRRSFDVRLRVKGTPSHRRIRPGGRGHVPPKILENILSGNYYVNFGHFWPKIM